MGLCRCGIGVVVVVVRGRGGLLVLQKKGKETFVLERECEGKGCSVSGGQHVHLYLGSIAVVRGRYYCQS